jgi:hypothetical protein
MPIDPEKSIDFLGGLWLREAGFPPIVGYSIQCSIDISLDG